MGGYASGHFRGVLPSLLKEIDMTEKAKRIVDKLKNRRAKKPWAVKEKVLQEFNTSTLDDVGPVSGGDREMKVLREMNELQEFENTALKRE